MEHNWEALLDSTASMPSFRLHFKTHGLGFCFSEIPAVAGWDRDFRARVG